MQLDDTQIAVRERSFLELMDLSLHVLRGHFVPLLWMTVLGAAPLIALNALLIDWMASPEYFEYETEFFPWRYVWNMVLLVMLEAPLASVFATTYLGKAVFWESPTYRQVIYDVWKCAVPILFCQMILRMPLAAWVLFLYVDRTMSDFSFPEVVLILIALVMAAVRAFRPFLNEIILLEQNPLRARNELTQTINRRSGRLHGASTGDLVLHWLGTAWISILLALSISHLFIFANGIFFGQWKWTPVMVRVFVPTALWIVTMYVTVARFLNYLDTRIRQEGWEVELRLKAEAMRLQSRVV